MTYQLFLYLDTTFIMLTGEFYVQIQGTAIGYLVFARLADVVMKVCRRKDTASALSRANLYPGNGMWIIHVHRQKSNKAYLKTFTNI